MITWAFCWLLSHAVGHIELPLLKLLIRENARVDNGNRWLVARKEGDICNSEIEFTVCERKPYHKKTRTLIETEDEELACRIPKGE